MSVFKCLERADYTFCSGCQRCLTRVELPRTSVYLLFQGPGFLLLRELRAALLA